MGYHITFFNHKYLRVFVHNKVGDLSTVMSFYLFIKYLLTWYQLIPIFFKDRYSICRKCLCIDVEDFYDTFPEVKKYVDRESEVLFTEFCRVMHRSGIGDMGPSSAADLPQQIQASIFCFKFVWVFVNLMRGVQKR